MDQLRGARNAVFRSWNNARAKEYRRIYDIPDSIGTAVNVQMMVFGNTGDRSGTGVGFTRNPATGAKEFFGEFLINAQGEDVVAGIRTPQPIVELETRDAEGLQAAARHHLAAREELQGHPGLRVHDPGREALHAADPQRQAHGLRGGRDRHRLREGEAGHAEGSDPAGRSGSAVAVARARIRSEGMEGARDRHQGPAGVAGRGVRQGGVLVRDRRRVVEQGRAGDPGAPRNRAGRHSRHVGVAGHSHRDRRHDLARGGRRPPDGQAVDRRRGRAAHRRARQDASP